MMEGRYIVNNYMSSILLSRYADSGTMLEVRDVKYTPDGRSIVNTVGSRRFKIVSKSVKDGYNTAVVEFLEVS